MDALRHLLVHIDSSPRCATRLKLAAALAQRHESHVTALLADSPALVDAPFAYAAGAVVADLLQGLEAERRQAAQAMFGSAFTSSAEVRWLDAAMYPPVPAVTLQSSASDLVVLGQREADSREAPGLPFDFVDSVVMQCGRPVLVVPAVGEHPLPAGVAAVAWKPTPECIHAVTGALPLLRRMKDVVVLEWTERAPEPGLPAPDVTQWLLEHGVPARRQSCGPAEEQPGESLLSRCADLDAELLVMGCYGHTRAREFVLGGVTRTVLGAMTLPVLMAH